MNIILDPVWGMYKDENGILYPRIHHILEGIDPNNSWYTMAGQERGTACHAVCHFYDENDLNIDTVLPEWTPYLEAWKKFRNESGFIPTIIEKSLVSKVYGFGGTPDRLGFFQGKKIPSIVEIKTGSLGVITPLQMAAQEILFTENRHYTEGKFACQLFKDGTYKLHEFNNDDHKIGFLSFLGSYNWKRKYLKNGYN